MRDVDLTEQCEQHVLQADVEQTSKLRSPQPELKAEPTSDKPQNSTEANLFSEPDEETKVTFTIYYQLPFTMAKITRLRLNVKLFSWFCVLQPQASLMMNYYFWVYFRCVTNVTNGLNGRTSNKEIAPIIVALFIKIALLLSWRQIAIQSV